MNMKVNEETLRRTDKCPNGKDCLTGAGGAACQVKTQLKDD
jgi:hypothetical protein